MFREIQQIDHKKGNKINKYLDFPTNFIFKTKIHSQNCYIWLLFHVTSVIIEFNSLKIIRFAITTASLFFHALDSTKTQNKK